MSSCSTGSFICVCGLRDRTCASEVTLQGLYSLCGRTSYRKISWSLEAARLFVIMIVLLWYLTCISAALLPRCLANCRAIEKAKLESRGFEISRVVAVRRPSAWWTEALYMSKIDLLQILTKQNNARMVCSFHWMYCLVQSTVRSQTIRLCVTLLK